jgi:hypothetical protein
MLSGGRRNIRTSRCRRKFQNCGTVVACLSDVFSELIDALFSSVEHFLWEILIRISEKKYQPVLKI